jgi:hypothetical protein
MASTTYLDLVNDVLVRLREQTVSTINQNPYSALVSKLINDAKREVEDSWNWEVLRTTNTITTTASTYAYALTGAGNKFKILRAYNDTEDWFMEYVPEAYIVQNALLTTSPQEGQPLYYSIKGIDASGDGLVNVWPIPDGVYELKFDLSVPETELSSDTDTTSLNKSAIVQLAWAKSIEERGEDGGIGVSSQYAVAKQALADAIAIEAGRRPDEVNWAWV